MINFYDLPKKKNLRPRAYVLAKSSEDPIVNSQQSPNIQKECCSYIKRSA